MAKQRETAPAFPAKPGKAETGCPLAWITWSWGCCPRRECGWGAEGVPVMSLCTFVRPFQPYYAFTALPTSPQKTRQRNCLDRQMEPSVGPVGNGFGFRIKAGPMTAWGEGIVTPVNV